MAEPIKVMVVESQRYRGIITKILTRDRKLRSFEIEVVESPDGMDALMQFKAATPDMVIQELILSKMSGFELVRALRQEPGGKTLPILVTTALTQDMTTLNMLKRHFNVEHLAKPFTPWDFAIVVHKLLSAAAREQERIAASVRKARPTPGPLKSAPSLVDVDFGGLDKTPLNDQVEVEAAAKTSGGMSKRFTRGNLSVVGLPSLLLDALEEKLSGTLILRQAKLTKVFYLLQGYPVFAQSNLRRETLGQMLVRRGLLTAEQNNNALAASKQDNVPYGEALKRQGLMESKVFGQELLNNVREKIEGSLLWRTGSWLFREDPVAAAKVPRCGLDPVKLVFDGLRKRSNVEESVRRISGQEGLYLSLLPRFTRYREQFTAIFGSTLVDVMSPDRTLNEMLQAMGSNPWDAILQVDILLLTGMGLLHETEEELAQQSGEFDPDAAVMQFRPDESMG